MPPITDTQVNALETQGYREGDTVPGQGTLRPDGSFSQPSVITSDPAVNQTNLNLGSLDKLLEEARALSSRAQVEIDAKNAAAGKKPAQQTPTKSTSVLDSTIQSMSDAGNSPEVQELRANYTKTISDIDALASRMDANSVRLMDSIRSEYDSLIKQQEELNKAYTGGVTTEGFVSGRARYAPIIQAGIVTNTVQQGIAKIADLQSKKARLLAEAQEARDNKQFELLDKKMKAYRDAIADERKFTQDLYENTLKASKEAREELKYQREEEEANAKMLAPSLVAILDGDLESNLKTITDIAAENGIDPRTLYNSVQEYQAQLKKEEMSSMTSSIKEYQYAVSQGYTGSFTQYEKSMRASSGGAGKENLLTREDVKAYGLPASFIGMSEDKLTNSLSSDEVPPWFADYADNEIGPPLFPGILENMWEDFKQNIDSSLQGDDDDGNPYG